MSEVPSNKKRVRVAPAPRIKPILPEDVADLRTKADKAFIDHRTKQAVKKYAVGIAGTIAVIMGMNGTANSNMSPEPVTAATAPGGAQTPGQKGTPAQGPTAKVPQTPGGPPTDAAADPDGTYVAKPHERWSIKTSIASDESMLKPMPVDVAALATFPPEPGTPKQFDDKFIDNQPLAGFREGQIVQTDGYIHLVAFEKTDDSDYHVQMNDKPTNAIQDLTPCVIVEIPHPKAASTPALAFQFAVARKLLRDQCFNGGTPTETVKTPIHVRVTGQLFYDLSHSGGKDPGGGRGKKVNGVVMKATTIWEIHPVTKIEILTTP